jgi:hypothetical protein
MWNDGRTTGELSTPDATKEHPSTHPPTHPHATRCEREQEMEREAGGRRGQAVSLAQWIQRKLLGGGARSYTNQRLMKTNVERARRGRRCGDDCTFQSSAAHLSCVVGAAAAEATAAVHRRHCALINQVSVTENRALAIDMSVSTAAQHPPQALSCTLRTLSLSPSIYGARANPAAGCEK